MPLERNSWRKWHLSRVWEKKYSFTDQRPDAGDDKESVRKAQGKRESARLT